MAPRIWNLRPPPPEIKTRSRLAPQRSLGQVQRRLADSYQVFLHATGSFLVVTKLHLTAGPIQWHVMGLDADRDIFYFGLNGRNCLTRIEVVHVVKMQLKVSQLKHAKFVAYEVRHKRGLDDDDADDIALWKAAGDRLDEDDAMVLCL
jgi:hypothetical protein